MDSNDLAIKAFEKGDFRAARDYFELEFKQAKKNKEMDREHKACLNLGTAYHSLGQFRKAIEFFQRALGIAEETGNKDSEGRAYLNLGSGYHSLGQFRKAIEFCQQALRIVRKTGNKDLEGEVCVTLAFAHCSLRQLEKGIEFFEKALGIAKDTGSKDLEARTNQGLGSFHLHLDNVEKAFEFLKQSLKIAKETGQKVEEGVAYAHLGHFYASRDFEKAFEFLQYAVSIGKETGSKGLERLAYRLLGIVFLEFPDDFSRTEEYFNSSIKLLEEMRDLLQDNDQWKISFRDQYSVYTDLWCLQLRQGKTSEAFFTAERGRAQALKDLMKSRYSVELTQLSSEEQMERISCISTHISSPTIFIAEVPEESVNFWLLLKGQQWQFVRKKTNQSLVYLIKKAQQQMKVDKPVRSKDRSLDGIEDEEIGESSSRGTNEEESTPPQEGDDALKKLYDIIIAPCLHLINGDELVIVPDGASFLIPYAALVDQNGRYLSETLRIRLAPSVTSLMLLAECPDDRHSTSGVLLVGDPWVETVRLGRKRFAQLPWAEKEVKMLEEMLNVQPLTGKNASKERVLRRLESVSLVHIAAHGRSETGEILLSPNHASPERPKEQDFLLTMEDVLKAKLRAKLVVLSCCHTGKGKICAEGVVGIARAFLGAGARSVIASLWAIEDKPTIELMRNLYEHLIAGHSASKSLNQAMKLVRESGEFNKVRQWAPFVLIGDDVTFDFPLLANEGKILTPS